MRRPRALLLIGALGLLIGALAVGGLTVWMSDDDAESRRKAALGDTTEKTAAEGTRTLTLTVVSNPKALAGSGWVRHSGTGRLCQGAAAPGKTCTWEFYVSNDPTYPTYLTVETVFSQYDSSRVEWNGCSSTDSVQRYAGGETLATCRIQLSADRSIKATFVPK